MVVGCGFEAEGDLFYGYGVGCVCDQDFPGCSGGDGGVWSIGLGQSLAELIRWRWYLFD